LRTDLSCALMRIFTLAMSAWASWKPGDAISQQFSEQAFGSEDGGLS
jgi:hypothetical protein